MSHSITLNPSAVTVTPGGPAETVVATISGVPDDVVVTDVVEAVLGAVTATANLTVTLDNPEPIVQIPSPSPGVTYQIATPVQDASDPTVWTCDIAVSA